MIKKIIYNYLVKEKIVSLEDNYAENSINVYDDRQIVISGNKLGLIELADYIISVALADVDQYHIHLDETNFFNNTNLELVILNENEKKL